MNHALSCFFGPGPKARISKRFVAVGFCFADSLGVLLLALSCDWQQKTKATADDLKEVLLVRILVPMPPILVMLMAVLRVWRWWRYHCCC